MPLENSLNVNPYFDDYDLAKEYYKVLFKPGVSVQTRELNQLQTMLQNQIEKFGDNIFKSGTILSGINFSYLPNYSYAKILDIQTDGQPSQPSSYVDFFVKSDLNLAARIVNYVDGLESNSPNLKTLYLQYTNSSDKDTANSNTSYTVFSPGQNITVFSKDYPIFKVTVDNGGLGFSNADSVVVLSSIIVTGNTVAFSNGETLTSSAPGAPKVTIASINTTAIANTTIIQVKPRTVDLTNNSVNSVSWSLLAGYNISGNTSSATANVVSFIGSGATGLLTTDTLGIIQTITLTNQGNNYTFLPTFSVKTANASATVGSLSFVPQNFKTVITVANSSVNAIGTGYAFGISGGVIYQKGFFLNVDPQVVIISKYDISPNNAAVGLITDENLITSFADETLYDNAANTTNFAAPGADRLQLLPILTVVTNASSLGSNANFLTLVEWKDGAPFKENKTTVYSNIGDEMARRSKETNGNFVINPFEISSREKSTANLTSFDVVIDPGTAYVEGYRVSSQYNTVLAATRANTFATESSRSITVSYGNYVYVDNLAGLFDFKAGAAISLRDTAKSYVSSATIGSDSNITPAGSEIGTARIRSLVVNSGNPGTSTCVYRLYLFDILMNAGQSFRSVRSVYYNSIADGIADIALTYDATTGTSIAVIQDNTKDKMLFPVGTEAVKSISGIMYQYRTSSDSSVQLTSGGTLQIGPLGSGLTLPYSDGVLSSTQERDFIIFPLANTQVAANSAGAITVTNNSNVVSGSSTTFASDYVVGDFIKLANTTANIVRQISYITNNTSMGLTTNATASFTANGILFYPAMYPISLESRSDRTITISASSKTATLNITKTLSGTVNAIVTFNISKVSATPVAKTISRDLFVKIHTSNNAAGAMGPWYLGVPGIARLKKVYLGSNTTVNTSSTDITKYFFIDTGDDQNAYRSGQLVLANKSGVTLTANQFLMVQFDAFTTGGAEGFFTADSYNINDTANLASSTATINTLEIPETVTKTGTYYDLRDVFDFRPYGTNTAILTATASSASINPANTFALSGDDQFFPVPDSTVSYTVDHYLPRIDSVAVDTLSTFSYIQGSASKSPQTPKIRDTLLLLGSVYVPPYPCLPRQLNTQTSTFADKQVGNARGPISTRVSAYRVKTDTFVYQPKRYTMADIGKIIDRVSSIEYQISLGQVEQATAGLKLPSVITPTTSRFNSAFFVDTFDNFSRSATTSREYSASIDTDRSELQPLKRQLNFECSFDRTDPTTANNIVGSTLMLPYTESTFIDQTIKSDVLGVDGHAIQFAGNMSSSPSSFSLLAQVETILDPPIINVNVPGAPTYVYVDPPASSASGSGGGGGGHFLPFIFGTSIGGRVICTHFYRKGMISTAVWRADMSFTMKRLSPTTVRGYQYWAIPYVHLMRKSPLAEKIMFPLAKWRAEELAYQEGVLEKGNIKGKIVRAVFEPICFAIGLFVGEQNWKSLWT